MTLHRHEAIAIQIGNRFFTKITLGGVQTAWSIAGATLFLQGGLKLARTVKQLQRRKREYTLVNVTVSTMEIT